MKFFDMVSEIARDRSPGYMASYDGDEVDKKILTEDIPLQPLEETEADQELGNLSQQSFVHRHFDDPVTVTKAKGKKTIFIYKPKDE